jgi:hypothetical protein
LQGVEPGEQRLGNLDRRQRLRTIKPGEIERELCRILGDGVGQAAW